MLNLCKKEMTLGLCLLALDVCFGGASAGEVKDSGTVTYNLSQGTHIPLTGGKILTEQRMSGIVIAANSTLPFHLSSQDCVGAGVGDGKGVPDQDYGVCVAFDKDGDAWWLSYSNKGDDRRWTVISGTGKYAGMTGTGTTKLLALTPDGRMSIAWSGTMNMR